MYLKRLRLDASDDQELAQRLFVETPGYSLHSFASLPTREQALSLFSAYPAQCPDEDRLAFAAYEHQEAVGLVQVARHYPTPNLATILLCLVADRYQRRHRGCELIECLSRQARNWSIVDHWLLSVLDSNKPGIEFWCHCGFTTESVNRPVRGFTANLNNMHRKIKAKPCCKQLSSRNDMEARREGPRLFRLPTAEG